MTAVTVTVVVPTLHRPAQLRQCLDALRTGSLAPNEVIVCDQSSHAVAELVAAECFDVRYEHLSLPNAAAARQAGLEAASTDWVAFTDDDCVPDHTWLAELVAATSPTVAGEGPIVATSGGVQPLPGSAGVPVGNRVGQTRRVFQAADGGLDRADWAPWDVGTGGNLMVRRSVALEVGGWDPRLGPGTPARAGEDVEFLLRIARAGAIVYTPTAIVRHAAATRWERLARRYPYGRGMGAMFVKQLRARDPAARPLLGLYLRHQAAAALRTGWGIPEFVLTASGLVTALVGGVVHRRAG